MALGFKAAFLRALRAIWAICSRVVPYSAKCRVALQAIHSPADGAPKGSDHCWKPSARKPDPPLPPEVTLARPPFPWADPSKTERKHRTWLVSPQATAAQA